MYPRASDLMDSTVYSNDNSPDASAPPSQLTRPSQQSASTRFPTNVPLHSPLQYLPPTQYTPELSESDSEERSPVIAKAHSKHHYPGSFPDSMQEQEPAFGQPSFNMNLKLGVVGPAPTHLSQTSFSTPVKQRLSTSRPPNDERRSKVTEINPLLEKELSSERNVCQSSSFVDLLFPQSRLPFPVNDTTLEHLAVEEIWNVEDASFTLKFQDYKESTIAQWLNVVGRLIGTPYRKKRTRIWYAGTCDQPPEGSQHVAKPDLVLIDRPGDKSVDSQRIQWRTIRSFAEVTSQSPIPKRLFQTVDRKTYIMYLKQDNRRFVPALIIGGEGYFSLTVTDRQGQIRMSPVKLFSPGKDVALIVLRILAFLMYAPLSDIGLDPSMVCDTSGRIESIFVNNINFLVVKRIYSLQALIGRGTKIWIVQQGEKFYILKDSWVLAGRVESEIDFLNSFAKHPALLGSVPVLIQGEDLQVNGVLDSTEHYRLPIGQINKHRVHRRHVTEPIGTPIVTFPSKSEFLSVIIDAIRSMSLIFIFIDYFLKFDAGFLVLRILHDVVHVLHRDISPNNILFVNDQGKAKCLLIDFDYAVSVGKRQLASHGFRTVRFVFVFVSQAHACPQGTPPFMALEIMLQGGKDFTHELRHDLESLLYVIIWMCNHMTAPGVERQLLEEGDIPHIRGWCNMSLSLQQLGHLKLAHIVDAERIVLAEFTSYWEDFKPFARRLLAEFFPVKPADPNMITPEKMVKILDEARSTVKEPEPHQSQKSNREPRSLRQEYKTLAGTKRDRLGQNDVSVSKRIKDSNVVSRSVRTNPLDHLESVHDMA